MRIILALPFILALALVDSCIYLLEQARKGLNKVINYVLDWRM